MIIQIIGLPGSGKTTLAVALKEHINAIHLNADQVRKTINSDLNFSLKDRIEHARRLGAMSKLLSDQGLNVIIDFICPTHETRTAFGKPDILIWMNRVTESKYEDTNKMWQNPDFYDLVIPLEFTIEEEVNLVMTKFNLFDWKASTTLILGRWQPWHDGHSALYKEAGKRTKQVLIGVRDTHGTNAKNPLTFEEVCKYIKKDSLVQETLIMKLPNITNIIYGRDVGYKIEQVSLGKEIEAISATQKRKELGIK